MGQAEVLVAGIWIFYVAFGPGFISDTTLLGVLRTKAVEWSILLH